jgi:hypothetical protein
MALHTSCAAKISVHAASQHSCTKHCWLLYYKELQVNILYVLSLPHNIPQYTEFAGIDKTEGVVEDLDLLIKAMASLSFVPLKVLLEDLQKMYKIDSAFITKLHICLQDTDKKFLFLCVDLDNVPTFFEAITEKMIACLPFEVFLFCSSSHEHQKSNIRVSPDQIHFFLASSSKNACAMAMSLFRKLISKAQRLGDTAHLIISSKSILHKVHSLHKLHYLRWHTFLQV